MGRSLARAAALTAAATFFVAPARANGRYPAANQLLVAPTDPNLIVLRVTFGLLVSHDGGAHWAWICEDAVGYGGNGVEEDPAIAVTQSSALLAGTQEGLAVSPDTGCSWAFAPAAGMPVADVTVRRDSPSSALALSSNAFGVVSDAGEVFSPALFLSPDNGTSWTRYGAPLDSLLLPETLDVAPSDHRRVYVSGQRVIAGTPNGALLVSADDGQTWTDYVVPIDPLAGDIGVFIGAIDPTDPDRVYLRIVRTTGSRLLVTDDGGKTLRDVFTTAVGMPGFAVSPDGSKVYLGGDDGIRVAAAADLTFSKVSETPVLCLAAGPQRLYACSTDANGFVVGASADDGKTFTALLHMCGIGGPLQCGAEGSQSVCSAEWPAVRATIVPDGGDAGCAAEDAGADAGGEPEGSAAMDGEASETANPSPTRQARAARCHCRAAGLQSTRGPSPLGGLLLLMVSAVARRRPRG
jgi:hypothetical protein